MSDLLCVLPHGVSCVLSFVRVLGLVCDPVVIRHRYLVFEQSYSARIPLRYNHTLSIISGFVVL